MSITATIGAIVDREVAYDGVFISSTACLAEMGLWRLALPAMRLIGRAPEHVEVFTQEQLVFDQTEAGLEIIHQWQPKKSPAAFLVARKKRKPK